MNWFIWIPSTCTRRVAGSSFIKATASELFTDETIIKRDIGTMLLQLEQLQQQRIEEATRATQPVELSATEKRSAMKLLKDPNLVQRILDDFDACGLAGEETGKLVGYLACVSRRLDQPLALLIQSGSSRRQNDIDGCGSVFHARGGSDSLQRHDRPVVVLHGPAESETQDPGDC